MKKRRLQKREDGLCSGRNQFKRVKNCKKNSLRNKNSKDTIISELFYSYIKREQEYRKTIDDIHNEIARRSSDPFGFLS